MKRLKEIVAGVVELIGLLHHHDGSYRTDLDVDAVVIKITRGTPRVESPQLRLVLADESRPEAGYRLVPA